MRRAFLNAALSREPRSPFWCVHLTSDSRLRCIVCGPEILLTLISNPPGRIACGANNNKVESLLIGLRAEEEESAGTPKLFTITEEAAPVQMVMLGRDHHREAAARAKSRRCFLQANRRN